MKKVLLGLSKEMYKLIKFKYVAHFSIGQTATFVKTRVHNECENF